jgi:hypothetical protein
VLKSFARAVGRLLAVRGGRGHDRDSADVTVEFGGNFWEFSTTVEKLVEKPRNHHDWRKNLRFFALFTQAKAV